MRFVIAGFIMSTSQWTEPRDLTTLPAFIQKRTSLYTFHSLSLTPSPVECPPLPKNIKKEGTPSVIILSLSGIRCADVVRSLKTMEPKPPGEIAKVRLLSLRSFPA